MMVMWLLIFIVFLGLWVIIKVEVLECFNSCWVFFCRCVCKVILIFVNGLLSRRIWGVEVKVWVSVICCCWLLESVWGYFFLNLLRLIVWSWFVIFELILFLFILWMLNVILLVMVMCGNNVWFWKMRLVFLCLGFVCRLGVVINWLEK